jgi:hypothetical protein
VPAGPFNFVAAYTAAGGSTPRDLVLDPDNWQRVYVVDVAGRVFRTVDAGATWTDITSNLGALATDLRSIAMFSPTPLPGDEAIFVGGLGGVFGSPDPVRGAATSWVKFGVGLPSYLVMDLQYSAGDDFLVAAGFGRGAWSVPRLSASVIR